MNEWTDPWPDPVIEVIEGIHVVRDDLIEYGSKVRFIDYLIGYDPENKHIEEWVYGSCPAQGYAQIGLPVVCNKYGKKAVLFMAARNEDKLHSYQRKGMLLGAQYNWVNMGMLAVTEKRAKDYVAAKPDTRKLLPIGLEHPTVHRSIIQVARRIGINPDRVWSVASSGTLSRGLQAAWPNAEHHCVTAGGHRGSYDSALVHDSGYKFNQAVKLKDRPPFPSAIEYDAKGWKVMMEWQKKNPIDGITLFWNVGA